MSNIEKAAAKNAANGLMTVDEACEYLGITKRLMDDLTGHKRIKYILLGGRKFRKEWLDDFVEKNAIDPA